MVNNNILVVANSVLMGTRLKVDGNNILIDFGKFGDKGKAKTHRQPNKFINIGYKLVVISDGEFNIILTNGDYINVRFVTLKPGVYEIEKEKFYNKENKLIPNYLPVEIETGFNIPGLVKSVCE